MTIKQQLIQEIESTSDVLLAETLDFLLFLKSKQAKVESTHFTSANSTGSSLLEHLKNIGTWEGNDLKECLEQVISSRGKAKFDAENPSE
jgi:hypothetical protein